MSRTLLWMAVLLVVLSVGLGACGGPRNCLIIPAQIELVEERRTVALAELENTARQLDRTRTSIERVRSRLEEVRAEKAFLDSLLVPGQEGGR